jgi:hypothetical protein
VAASEKASDTKQNNHGWNDQFPIHGPPPSEEFVEQIGGGYILLPSRVSTDGSGAPFGRMIDW